MFGKNPIRKSEIHLDGLRLALQEAFETIQGEGPQAGRPCGFIRLAGCNLACTFCDTEFEGGINNLVPIGDIVDTVLSFKNHKLVVLTGGEPMRQNIMPLLGMLLQHGVELIQIETAGTLWPEASTEWGGQTFYLADLIDQGAVQLVCSPKTPKIHHQVEQWCAHFKYIIRAGHQFSPDGLPAMSTQREHASSYLFRPGPSRDDVTIWLSPCDEHDQASGGSGTKANHAEAAALCIKHGYRLTLQMHKAVGVP